MNITSIGDLAQTLMLRHRSVELKQTISTLTDELNSGHVSDVSKRLGNDFSYLSDIERNLTRLGGFTVATNEAKLFADAAQTRLERLHDMSSELSSSLVSASPAELPIVIENLGNQAKGNLELVISALNGSVAGRSLFAGTATDRTPLATADVMLAELVPLVTGLTSAADVETAVRDWFSDPGGFEAVMYQGSDDTLSPIQIGPGQQVNMSLKADDPAFRDTLGNFALVALAGDTALGFDKGVQNDLFRGAGAALVGSQNKLTQVQADLGFAEARIEESATRNASARTGLEYAKNSLLEADPFEAAIRLKEAQFQLESLYTVTVRSSKLSLLNFMR